MSRAKDGDGNTAPVFSGRDARGNPRQDGGHAYYVALDEDGDGYLDHLLVSCERGFDDEAQGALGGLNRLWAEKHHDLHLSLLSLGAATDYGTTIAGRSSSRNDGRSPGVGPARVWVSHSPFVLFRHPKKKGGVWRDLPDEQLRLAASRRGLPEIVEIEPIGAPTHLHAASQAPPWHRHYRQRAKGGGSRGGHRGYGFRITFSEAVSGPLCLGYGAHFGLGAFLAEAF